MTGIMPHDARLFAYCFSTRGEFAVGASQPASNGTGIGTAILLTFGIRSSAVGIRVAHMNDCDALCGNAAAATDTRAMCAGCDLPVLFVTNERIPYSGAPPQSALVEFEVFEDRNEERNLHLPRRASVKMDRLDWVLVCARGEH